MLSILNQETMEFLKVKCLNVASLSKLKNPVSLLAKAEAIWKYHVIPYLLT